MSFESETNFTEEVFTEQGVRAYAENNSDFEPVLEEAQEVDIREILKDGFDDVHENEIIELNSVDDIENFKKAYGVDVETVLEQKRKLSV